MHGYAANIDAGEAVAFLADASPDDHTLIVTHAKPDGDALGSVLALTHTLRERGQSVTGVLVPPVPASLAALPGADALEVAADPAACARHAEAGRYTRAVVVDTGAWSQVGPLRPAIEPLVDRTLIIDHHLSGDIPAAVRLIDAEAAAAAELVAELVEMLSRGDAPAGRRADDDSGFTPLPGPVRDALFVGIASDTGWFRFSNTRPQTHELASRLLRMGTDHADLYRRLEQQDRPEKLLLMQRAVASMKTVAGGAGVLMSLRPADFAETGAMPEETDRLVDIPQATRSVEAVTLAVEQGDGAGVVTRLSFRSKPPAAGADAASAVNVADLAGRFGGGGHARAAGAKVQAPLDEVLPELEAALRAALSVGTA